MAQRPRRLRPELSGLHLLGAHLRTLRETRGLSQAKLGELVYCSGDLIRRIETAERRPHPDLIARLDACLESDGLLSRYLAPTVEEVADLGAMPLAVACLPSLRRCLDSSDCPPDGIARPAEELRAVIGQVVRLRVQSRYDEIAVILPDLLPELQRAYLSTPTNETAGFLIQAYRAADALADKYGYPDLSARLIDAMRHLADATTDLRDLAAVAYVRAEQFMISGDLAAGRRTLEIAIAGQPKHHPQLAAARGALHMRCAVLAARALDREDAVHHLAVAGALAERVPDATYRGTAFGPGSVRIHRLSAALDYQSPATAVSIGQGWRPGPAVPAERRSHFYIDLARAYLDVEHGDDCVAALFLAFEAAPQHARHHRAVRTLLDRMLAASPRPGRDLLDLRRRVPRPVEVR